MRKPSGFTLIELMIAVAIVAILAAIALPSYLESVRKSRRAQAKADLMELTQALERSFTTDRTFANFALVSPFDVSPHTGTIQYAIRLDKTATTYTLTATPQGAQSSDKCGTMSINQLSVKTASGALGVAGCW